MLGINASYSTFFWKKENNKKAKKNPQIPNCTYLLQNHIDKFENNSNTPKLTVRALRQRRTKELSDPKLRKASLFKKLEK